LADGTGNRNAPGGNPHIPGNGDVQDREFLTIGGPMGNSRKIVDRLQRIAKAQPKPTGRPNAPKENPPESNRRRPALLPEDLSRLRTIVAAEQLLPFKPVPEPPPNHIFSQGKSASRRKPKAAEAEPASPATEPAEAPRSAASQGAVTPAPVAHVPPQTTIPETVRKDYNMSNIETILKEAMQLDGAIGVALVDYTSGMTLGQAGGDALNLDVAAAGNTEVVRAKLRTMDALGLPDGIEDILITLTSQYHVIRLITDESGAGLFLYIALDKSKANLALARRQLANLENQLKV
jgi:hypothetical protein